MCSLEQQAGLRCLLEGDQQRELGGSQVQTLRMSFSATARDRNLGKGLQDRDAWLREALEIRVLCLSLESLVPLSGCDAVTASLLTGKSFYDLPVGKKGETRTE